MRAATSGPLVSTGICEPVSRVRASPWLSSASFCTQSAGESRSCRQRTMTTGAFTRVMAAAKAGEVLASRVVRDLVAGSGLVFPEHGLHELKGIPGAWELYRASAP